MPLIRLWADPEPIDLRRRGHRAADAMRNAAARVLGIAAVHERLYTGEDATVVRLDTFLHDLCDEIGRAYGCRSALLDHATRLNRALT